MTKRVCEPDCGKPLPPWYHVYRCSPECARERRRAWDVHYVGEAPLIAACGFSFGTGGRAWSAVREDTSCPACLAAIEGRRAEAKRRFAEIPGARP